jgi:hypothetical protein
MESAKYRNVISENMDHYLEHALLSARAALQNLRQSRDKAETISPDEVPDLTKVEERMKQVSLDIREISADLEGLPRVSKCLGVANNFKGEKREAINLVQDAINSLYAANCLINGIMSQISNLKSTQRAI